MDGKNPESDAALPRRKHTMRLYWGETAEERRERVKREDEDYAAKCGPVTVRTIDKDKK